MSLEKHQAERRKWLEEKLLLIGQAKEAEERRNQDMKRFAEDRERFTRQQSQLVSGVCRRSELVYVSGLTCVSFRQESLSSKLAEKDQRMETWRKERDALVSALEVQLKKLLTSQAEKDRLIEELRRNEGRPQVEVSVTC